MDPAATTTEPPNPYLQGSILYSPSGISLPDATIVDALSECTRFRFRKERIPGQERLVTTGVEFERSHNAEKAYAIVVPPLYLHISRSAESEPVPTAQPIVIKDLPESTTPGAVFDLFRPFGPLFKVEEDGGGRFVVRYYFEEHAKTARREMHCVEVGGNSVAVALYKPTPEKSNRTPKSTPLPPRASTSIHATPVVRSRALELSIKGTATPKSDRRNLFVKSLHKSLTTSDLYSAFSRFGSITSALVALDSSGLSKGFGYVAYTNEQDAARALESMDGEWVGVGGNGARVTVRVHEKKDVREATSKTVSMHPPSSPVAAFSSLSLDTPVKPSTVATPPTPITPSNEADIQSAPAAVVAEEPVALASEHDRLLKGVADIETGGRAAEIVKLLEKLSKKERAKLLFDPDRLRRKVSEALEILDFSSSSHGSDNDDDNDLRPHVPVTPRSKQAIASLPTPQSQPHSTSHTSSPPLSPSPTPTSSSSVAPISELATLPISQIIALIESGGAKSYGIDAVSSEKRQESVKFMDELEGAGQEGVDEKKAVREVKQKLGERLFKVLKTLGIKGAPRITIKLLDTTESLRDLCALVDYPDVLREVVVVDSRSSEGSTSG